MGVMEVETQSLEGLEARRDALREAVPRSVADATVRLRALADVDRTIRQRDEALRAAEVEQLARVHEAMRRLRDCPTPEALIEAAPHELCVACGFSRAMISRVRGSDWVPVRLAVGPGMDADEGAFPDFARTGQIPLEHLLLETDLVRRRVPALVVDAAHDVRTSRTLVELSRTTSYVAAPILPTRRVIGFLHADRYGEDAPCDERDRDMLWVFAEHFGLLFERAVLVERLQEQRTNLERAFREAAAGIAELNDAELALVRRGPLAPPPSIAMRPANGASRIDALLTRRERDVVELLVSGATNAMIARQLVVSEGTVKSHLKRILRKLHVTNRAEAVAKYLHILRLDEQGRGR